MWSLQGTSYYFEEQLGGFCNCHFFFLYVQELAPHYEKLGAAFAGEKNVVIGKVDATAEEELGSRYDIAGFPTLKYFPAGAGDAGRTAHDFNGRWVQLSAYNALSTYTFVLLSHCFS